MSVIINTNVAAITAASNLSMSNDQLTQAIAELSSGSKITSSADDPGGLAVSMRLTAAIDDSNATDTNVQDATSFLQTQDGALTTVGNILDRISELQTLSTNVTESPSDIANYNTEFTSLQSEISALAGSQFNGVNLFGGTTLAVSTTADGSAAGDVTISQSNLAGDANVSAITGAANLSALTSAQVTSAITSVASMLAANGAETSQLGFASSMLTTNENNLTSANSTITDVDVAKESTALARDNIMVQAGTSMLAQANSSDQNVLKLLQG
jgi:flagellin